MRIVVFGAGSMGSLVGGLLTRRHDVTLIGRQPHVQTIEESGLVISGLVEAVMVPHAREDVSGLPPPDIVLITVKSYDTKDALEAIRPLVSKETLVVSLQNGLKNAELTSDAYPGKAVIGVTALGAAKSGAGRVFYAGEGDTYFGALDGDAGIAQRVVDIFNSVGLDSYLIDDIMKEVWSKVVINSAINPLTAIIRCKNGRILKDDNLWKVAAMTCLEGVNIANACGIRLNDVDTLDRLKTVLRKTSENRSSMFQDVEKRRRTEITEINGELVRRAELVGIDPPFNRILHLLILSITKYE
jgi:2-dehydropantoate 2-reductase